MGAVVIGAGISGLAAAVTLASFGHEVDLVSQVPAARSDTSLNMSGIASFSDIDLDDLLQASCGLGHPPILENLIHRAPDMLALCRNLGVPFDTRPDGRLIVHGLPKGHMAAGARTGAVLLRLLDGQARAFESEGLIRRHESSEFLSTVRDEQGDVAGVVIVNRPTMEIQTLPATTLLIASGGVRDLFERAPTSIIASGAALGSLFREGALLTDMEFVQWQPSCIKKSGITLDVGNLLLARGARPVLIRKQKRWYYLEDLHPTDWRHLSPSVAFKALHDAQAHMEGGAHAYLDATSVVGWNRELAGLKDDLSRWVGVNVTEEFIPVVPGDPTLVGGLWTDEAHRTVIKGVFAAGECQNSGFGAQMTASHRLLASLSGGSVAASKMIAYARVLDRKKPAQNIFDEAIQAEHQKLKKIRSQRGNENAYAIHAQMTQTMTHSMAYTRNNRALAASDDLLTELKDRCTRASLRDQGYAFNEDLLFLRRLPDMIEVAQSMVRSALYRNESRGMHFKPEFPARDDEKYLKSTRARFAADGPLIEYGDVHLRKRLTNIA